MKRSTAERWLTIAPATLMLLSIALLPMFELAAMSVSRIDWREGQAQWSYVGVANYARALGDSLFRAGIANTVVFALAAVGVQMVLGFALALMTTKVTRGRVFYRTVFILPILVPGIVIGAIWKLMYSLDFGVLNQMLGVLGAGPVDWLGNPSTALLAVIAVDVWHWTPFVFLLLLAGLESLPQDIYEAAKVDGATAWQRFRRITLPLLMPALLVALIFRTLDALRAYDLPKVLTNGANGTTTMSLIAQRTFQENRLYGEGAAYSIITFVIVMIVSFMYIRFVGGNIRGLTEDR
jgi:multiple sugar transport system permease protein